MLLVGGPTWNSKVLKCYFPPPLSQKLLGFKSGPDGLRGFISERTRNEGDLGSLLGMWLKYC